MRAPVVSCSTVTPDFSALRTAVRALLAKRSVQIRSKSRSSSSR